VGGNPVSRLDFVIPVEVREANEISRLSRAFEGGVYHTVNVDPVSQQVTITWADGTVLLFRTPVLTWMP
jgi:hypothetical protein